MQWRTHPTWGICFASILVVFPVYKVLDLAFDGPLIHNLSNAPPFAVWGCWFLGFTFLAATIGVATASRHGLELGDLRPAHGDPGDAGPRVAPRSAQSRQRQIDYTTALLAGPALAAGCKSGMNRVVAALVRRWQITCCGNWRLRDGYRCVYFEQARMLSGAEKKESGEYDGG